LKLDLSDLRATIGNDFRTEWGSGRRGVSGDLFETAKRTMEEAVKLPILRADEPPIDGYKVPIGRDFRYNFMGLLSKKRNIEKMSESIK